MRIISFVGGALFGAGGAVLVFRFVEHSPIHCGMVGLVGVIIMGLLAALLGRKFWDNAISIWP
jgi:hypothetical protein